MGKESPLALGTRQGERATTRETVGWLPAGDRRGRGKPPGRARHRQGSEGPHGHETDQRGDTTDRAARGGNREQRREGTVGHAQEPSPTGTWTLAGAGSGSSRSIWSWAQTGHPRRDWPVSCSARARESRCGGVTGETGALASKCRHSATWACRERWPRKPKGRRRGKPRGKPCSKNRRPAFRGSEGQELLLSGRAMVLPAQGNRLVVRTEQPSSGARHPMGGAPQVVEHALGTAKGVLGVADPFPGSERCPIRSAGLRSVERGKRVSKRQRSRRLDRVS